MDEVARERKRANGKKGPCSKKERRLDEADSSSSVTVTNERERLWASMYKGNAAVCNGVFNFNWTHCDEIMLHDGTKYIWIATFDEKDIWVCFGAKSVAINNVPLQCDHSASFDYRKAKEILSTMHKLCSNAAHIVQQQRPYALTKESDSGDETVIDEAILPAFPSQVWDIINTRFRDLRTIFIQAKVNRFDNASGKFFMHGLMTFCCWVDFEKQKYVHHGTNSSGEEQPGCSQLTLKTPKSVNDRSTSRSTSTPSTPASTPTPEPGDSYENECHSHYADQVYWDSRRNLYTIVGEIKSVADYPAENQNIEQMVGLFRSYQNYMLGYIVKPDTIQFRILEKQGQSLRMHNFEELPLSSASTLELICQLFIAFIFFVDC